MPVNGTDDSTLLWSIISRNAVTETASTPFSPSDKSADPIRTGVLVAVQNVIYVSVLPVLLTVGVITNVINIVIFSRQGLADRINMCLFRQVINRVTDRSCVLELSKPQTQVDAFRGCSKPLVSNLPLFQFSLRPVRRPKISL